MFSARLPSFSPRTAAEHLFPYSRACVEQFFVSIVAGFGDPDALPPQKLLALLAGQFHRAHSCAANRLGAITQTPCLNRGCAWVAAFAVVCRVLQM
jgi:hypothetical protein